jgi:hypothetical protein
MDFIEGFPKTGGKSMILTVVDHLSKYAYFIALGHPYTATTVTVAFFEQIVRVHGMPAPINSVTLRCARARCSGLRRTGNRMSLVFSPQYEQDGSTNDPFF